MKITGHILLVTLYCIVTIGMTISTHYCGGIPVSSSFGSSTNEPDTCCGAMESESDCCSTVVTTKVLTDDHAAAAQTIITALDAVVVPLVADARVSAPDTYHLPHPIAFTPGSPPPLTILHSCFLI